MTGATRPASSSGQTFFRSSSAMAPFCGRRPRPHGRARNRQALAHHLQQIEPFDLGPELRGHLDQSAIQRQAIHVALEVRRTDDVDDDIDSAAVRQCCDPLAEVCGLVIDGASAPNPTQAAHFSSLPAVAKTRAPNSRASCIAVTPMPLVPPWINTDSPRANRPCMNMFAHTVKNVSGSAAARTAS